MQTVMSDDSGPNHSPDSDDYKLPRAKAKRRSGNRNEWLAADAAERRKPIILIIFLVLIVAAGIALAAGWYKI